jgi:ketosteroid isomerase-like protein
MAGGTAHRDEILASDASFFSALLHQNRSALEELLAPDFFIVDVRVGDVTNRADFIQGVGSGLVSFESIETLPEHAIVREYPGTGIVIGTTSMRFRLPDGTSFNGRSRYTHAFIHSAGKWQLASAQGTPLASD